MKKFFAVLLALMLICASAYAAPVYTVTSRDRFTDDQGVDVVRTRGTIAMDSAYPYDATTGRKGYTISPAVIGMKTISQMRIEPAMAKNVGANGGVVLFRYTPTGTSGTGVSGPSIRGYYVGLGANLTAAPFTSLPSYDLSDLTAVPFEAIGT